MTIGDRLVMVTIYPRQAVDDFIVGPGATALGQLPAPVAGFTGRADELAVMMGLLDPSKADRGAEVSAVAGLAGVGKTSLAVQAGHAARDRGWYGGGVLFIDLHGYDEAPVVPAQALDALLRALGVPAELIPQGVEERAALYRSVLAQITDPVLVIADNASNEAQVRPLLPGTGPHRVVVTSRHTLAGLGARLVDVTVLDVQASIALLETAVRSARPGDIRVSNDPAAAALLAEMCGGLPLALQITAALLNATPTLSAGELAEELGMRQERLARLRYDDGSGDAVLSVAAAFELSYRRLDRNAARMFRLLPVNPGPSVSTAAAAVLADLPISEVRGILGGLARAHLADAAAGAGGRWRMHDLLRLYAARLSDEHAATDSREQARDRLLNYYLATTAAADQHLRALQGTTAPAEFNGRDAALAWLDAEQPGLIAAVNMADETSQDQVALRLPIVLAEYLSLRRRFDDMLAIGAVSLKMARHLGNRSDEGAALTVLGSALREVRRFEEAISVLQEAVAIFRETGDRHGEGQALTSLGAPLREVRRFEEAISVLQEAVAIFRETGDRHGEGQALGNLGNTLREVRRFEEAISVLQEAVAIFRETGDRHGEGITLGNLGAVLQELARLEEAISVLQEAVAIFRETGDRHGEGITLGNLGAVLQELARLEEAISVLQEAVAIFRETGDRHGEGITLGNLGAVLQELARLEEAISVLQEAVAIFRETGDRHGEGITLGNLGVALQELRRYEEAISMHQDAAAIFRETGDRHGEGQALVNLGVALQKLRRYEEAISMHQDAAAIFRETGDRYSEGQALVNLGNALREVLRYEDAINVLREAAAVKEANDQVPREGQIAASLKGNQVEE